MPATFFRTAHGRLRALRISGSVFFLSAAANFITRGWNAVPWVAWLLMSAGAFVMSLSEADTPPARSRGLILVYVIAFAAVALGAVLLLIDMGRHPSSAK
jgi:hypothetical protein